MSKNIGASSAMLEQVIRLEAELSLLREQLARKQEELEATREEVKFFRGVLQNRELTPGQKIATYSLWVAEEEEKYRVEICCKTPECEKTVLKGDRATMIAAKKGGLHHINIGRPCNIGGIGEKVVRDIIRLLYIHGYIEKKTFKYWREDNGCSVIREATYLRMDKVKLDPKNIRFSLELKRKRKHTIKIEVPVACSCCGSDNMLREVRTTCRECGSIRTYTGEIIQFNSKGE